MCKLFDVVAAILLIVGGLNWGLVGLWNFDLVASLFGAGSPIALVIYDLVGLSAIYRILMWYKGCCGICKK